MQIDLTHEENISIITVANQRLDASKAPEFKSRIIDIMIQNDAHTIIDISAVKFMDSSSLGSMITILKSTKNQKKLVITGASGVVMELFKLTKMDKVFTLSTDIVQAKSIL